MDSFFFATLANGYNANKEEVFKWNNVEFNNGGHYSEETGAYTVPYNGTYQ